MRRNEILNFFISTRGYKSYLEIGVRSKPANFDLVHCELKHGVDPEPSAKAEFVMTSDEFFATTDNKYDLCFVDGNHLSEFVERDTYNALKHLNPGGVVMLHDCLPSCEEAQRREMVISEWCGDVWKFWVQFRRRCSFLTYTLLMDCGCSIIDTTVTADTYPPLTAELDWNWFCQNQWAFNLKDKIQ